MQPPSMELMQSILFFSPASFFEWRGPPFGARC